VTDGHLRSGVRATGGSSKTITRILSDDQLADYQPWLDNQRKLRALITELEALSLAITDTDPRWQR